MADERPRRRQTRRISKQDGEAHHARGLARRRTRERSFVEWPGRRLYVPNRLATRRNPDPQRAWTRAASEILRKSARRYNEVVYFPDLVDLVEARSGVRRQGHETWLHTILEELTVVCIEQNEPVVTALCVNEDGTPESGYSRAMRVQVGDGRDVHTLADEQRLRCYRHFHAAGLPVDGGSPSRPLARKPKSESVLTEVPIVKGSRTKAPTAKREWADVLRDAGIATRRRAERRHARAEVERAEARREWASKRNGVALQGSVVTVHFNGDPSDTAVYLLMDRVGLVAVDIEILSPASPLGAALLNARVGETRTYLQGRMTATLVGAKAYEGYPI